MNYFAALLALGIGFTVTFAVSLIALKQRTRQWEMAAIAVAAITLGLDSWLDVWRLYSVLIRFGIGAPATLTPEFIIVGALTLLDALSPILLLVGIVAVALKQRWGLYALLASGALWIAQMFFFIAFTFRLG